MEVLKTGTYRYSASQPTKALASSLSSARARRDHSNQRANDAHYVVVTKEVRKLPRHAGTSLAATGPIGRTSATGRVLQNILCRTFSSWLWPTGVAQTEP